MDTRSLDEILSDKAWDIEDSILQIKHHLLRLNELGALSSESMEAAWALMPERPELPVI